MPARNEALELKRVSRVVPSRVADNTFWLGRYVERAENQARVLRSMIPRVHLAEEGQLGSLLCLHSCIGSRYSKLPKLRRKAVTYALLEKEMLSLLTDGKRPDSLPSTLGEVARVGGNVRERLSADMILLIGQLRSSVHGQRGLQLSDYSVMLTKCLELLSAFSGLERENVIRGSGWLFMSLGRRLERAVYLTRELRQITRPLAPENWTYLESLLEVADTSMTYRARYYTTLQPLAVLDVLMADEANPRSLDFQLEHLADLYRKLPRYLESDLEAMQQVIASMRVLDLQGVTFPADGKAIRGTGRGKAALAQAGRPPGQRQVQPDEDLLPSWSNNLSSHYFSHARTFPITMGGE